MRSFLMAVLALVAVCLGVPAQAAECAYSEAKFMEDAAASKVTVWEVSKTGVPVIMAKVNEVRASRGAPPYVADTVLIGVFEHNGQLLAAVMFIKDGCTIPKSSLILPAGDWARAMATLGLKDADFIPVRGS